jgi:hypothetical protein
LSKLPKEIVDQLSMFGLIEARNGLYGFRDLAAARQVAGLLAAGTALSVITKSLHEIRKWLPDAGLSNLKLYPESSDRVLVEQMEGRTDKRKSCKREDGLISAIPPVLRARSQLDGSRRRSPKGLTGRTETSPSATRSSSDGSPRCRNDSSGFCQMVE